MSRPQRSFNKYPTQSHWAASPPWQTALPMYYNLFVVEVEGDELREDEFHFDGSLS